MLGYILSRDNSQQKFFMLYGGGGTGKSVVCKVLRAMIGKENCSTLNFTDMQDRFKVHYLAEKIFNLMDEAETDTKDILGFTERLKNMTGGNGTVQGERKGRDSIEMAVRARLVISTNNRPEFQDSTSGIFRRIVAIPMNKNFSERRDVDLLFAEKIIADELPGILNWALVGWDKVRKSENFFGCDEIKEGQRAYRQEADKTLMYISDCLVKDDGGGVNLSMLYQDYNDEIRLAGGRPKAMPKLRKAIEDALGATFIHKRTASGRVRIMQGCRFVGDEESQKRINICGDGGVAAANGASGVQDEKWEEEVKALLPDDSKDVPF